MSKIKNPLKVEEAYVIIVQMSPLKLDHRLFSTIPQVVSRTGIPIENIVQIEGPILYQVLTDPNVKTFSRDKNDAHRFVNEKYKTIGVRDKIKYGNPMIIPETALVDFLSKAMYKIWDNENNKIEIKELIDL